MPRILDGHLARKAWKEVRNPTKRQRIGFATPLRRDAAAIAIGGAFAVGAVAVSAPIAAVTGALVFGAGVYDAFDKGFGVRGRR